MMVKENGILASFKKISGLQGALANNMMIAIVIVVFMIVASFASNNFFTASNLTNVLQQISVTGILALGAGVVLVSGHVDLSVGMMVTFVACFCAFLYERFALSFNIIPVIGMLLAIGCGTLNGFIISRSKAESFIVTLGMTSVFQGLALTCTNAGNISLAGNFSALGGTRIPVINLPISVIIFLSIFVVLAIIMRYTRYGRKIFALGGNEEAAMLAGVDIKKYKMSVFIINGLLAGIASLILLSRLGSANGTIGGGMELNAIAAAVVGGISLSGGKGNMLGALLGMLLLGLIQNALNIMRVPTFYQYVVIGCIIVVAVVFSSYDKKK